MSSLRTAALGLFTAILVLQCFGVYPVFRAMRTSIQKEVKAQIKAGIPEDQLLSFSFEEIRDQIEWTKPSKEFRYFGGMYDVIRWDVIEGDSIVVCFADLKERGLFASLDALILQQGYGDTDQPGILFNASKVFFSVYLPGPSLDLSFHRTSGLRKPIPGITFPTSAYSSGIDRPPQESFLHRI